MNNMILPLITESERQLPFYLKGVGCYYIQEHVKRTEGYPAFQWIQCHHGAGELIVGGRNYLIKPQQGIFLYPNTPHEYYEVEASWEVDWIGFNGYQVEELVQKFGFAESGIYWVTNSDLVLTKMRRTLSVAQSTSQFRGMECSGLVYELLLDLYKYTSKNSDDSILQQYSRLQPVFDYIEENFSQVITLGDLADTINVTPQYLCLLFKNILKMRPFEYLNQVRINKSKDIMFSRRELEIKTIARLVGYDSISYFCFVFKQIENISPGQFRKLHGIQ